MKKILFVINTLGCAGAENAMLEFMRNLNPEKYEVSLFVLMNQGEMIRQLPSHVKVLNVNLSDSSVLSKEGKAELNRYILRTMFQQGSVWKNLPYLLRNFFSMLGKGKILPDKLLWKVMSDGVAPMTEHYDMAVAYLEGGSAYYVANHVEADKKVGFVHIDYGKAGYTRALDQGCYDTYERIYGVSDEVKEHFVEMYPEYEKKTEVFHNMVNQTRIRERAQLPGGFEDDYDGTRILTVGRLTAQKAYEIAVEAMKLLKENGYQVRWYVLGEGEERKSLEKQIREYGLQEDFMLLGAKENPYPYYAQTDLYVHATRYEGKSIAIQEAQTLGCTILVSDCSGNREQVEVGVDGQMCDLTPEGIYEGIVSLLKDKEACRRYGEAAGKKDLVEREQLERFLALMNEK
nr:glycosyltransferase [Eubacterium sp.]